MEIFTEFCVLEFSYCFLIFQQYAFTSNEMFYNSGWLAISFFLGCIGINLLYVLGVQFGDSKKSLQGWCAKKGYCGGKQKPEPADDKYKDESNPWGDHALLHDDDDDKGGRKKEDKDDKDDEEDGTSEVKDFIPIKSKSTGKNYSKRQSSVESVEFSPGPAGKKKRKSSDES